MYLPVYTNNYTSHNTAIICNLVMKLRNLNKSIEIKAVITTFETVKSRIFP